MTKDLFGISVIVRVNAINHVILENVQTMCRKQLVSKLIEECTENIDEAKIAEITSTELQSMNLHSAENKNKHKCSSCILQIVLFSIIFTINIGIAT